MEFHRFFLVFFTKYDNIFIEIIRVCLWGVGVNKSQVFITWLFSFFVLLYKSKDV